MSAARVAGRKEQEVLARNRQLESYLGKNVLRRMDGILLTEWVCCGTENCGNSHVHLVSDVLPHINCKQRAVKVFPLAVTTIIYKGHTLAFEKNLKL